MMPGHACGLSQERLYSPSVSDARGLGGHCNLSDRDWTLNCWGAVQLNDKTGWNLGIHVDGASGGFVAPFIDQELVWDFK